MTDDSDVYEPLTDLVILQTPSKTSGMEEDTNFSRLKLIEKPNSPLNSESLPQTLEGCAGFLKQLPLKQPNVDQKNPQTIVDMINISTFPGAVDAFEGTQQTHSNSVEQSALPGTASNVYDYTKSAVMKKQLNASRKRTSHKRILALGHVVRPGSISLYNKDGKTYAVTEGCWFLTPFRASWAKYACNINLNQDTISPQGTQVLIVRVLDGEVGLVMEQGVATLLDVGTHVYNSGTVKLECKRTYAESNYFYHGPYNYLRVPRGSFAKVWVEVRSSIDNIQSLVPRLLKEGEHYAKSSLFKFDGLVKASDEYIEHGSVHVISVSKGNVAKVFHENRPRLLGEGVHIIESTMFEYKGMESILTNPCIVHGTITILRVTLGEIALAWKNNEPLFIDQPGLYEFDCADFCFVEFKKADERQITLGAKKIIQVYTGEVGITYEQGELRVLSNGRHVIDSGTHVFQRFLSTKQKSIRLVTLHADEKSSREKERQNNDVGKKRGKLVASAVIPDDKDSDLTICETKDLVKVGIRADVFYSIANPEKCIKNIDTEELDDLVRETAVATLTNIIRSTGLNQIAQSKHVSVAGTNDTEGTLSSSVRPQQPINGLTEVADASKINDLSNSPFSKDLPLPTAPMFFERAHDEFMTKLHDDFMQRYGVDIANIRMESFKIMDTELSYQMSKQALTTAQVENELSNLEGQSLILTQKKRTEAEVRNINADAEARALKTTMDAENQRKIDAAEAEAKALKIALRAKAEAESEAVLTKANAEAKAAQADAEAMKIKAMAQAEAESNAILMYAKAEAEAIKLKAAAESERAGVLSNTKLGQQECLLGIYADMIKQSNQGVEKVLYLDPNVNQDSPFAIGSLNNLNRDLHALSKLGIAISTDNNTKVK